MLRTARECPTRACGRWTTWEKTFAGVQIRPRQEHCRGSKSTGSTTLMVQNDFADFKLLERADSTTAARWKIWRRPPFPSRGSSRAGPGFTRSLCPARRHPACSPGPRLTSPRPPALVLDPHEYPVRIARGQLLVWLVPPHQHNLEDDQEDIYCREGARGHKAVCLSYQTQN